MTAIGEHAVMYNQITLPDSIRVDSAPPLIRQILAIGIVCGLWGLAGLSDIGESFSCDEAGRCALRRSSIVGSSVIKIGDSDRIVDVESTVHRRRSSSSSRRRHSHWEIVLQDPAQRLSIDKRLGHQVDGWLKGTIMFAGQKIPPRALPAHYAWRTSTATILAFGFILVFISVVLLRFIVRYELTATFQGVPTLQLTVRRFWFWKTSRTMTGQLGVRARLWYFNPVNFFFWRPGRSRRDAPLWGVWCETVPGSGHWLAAGLTEIEAETVADALSARR